MPKLVSFPTRRDETDSEQPEAEQASPLARDLGMTLNVRRVERPA